MLERPKLNSTQAQLFVADIATSTAFYCDKLGFAVTFAHGVPPFFAQVMRDEARLNLRVVGEPVFVGDVREREQLLSASLTVSSANEIQALFCTYEAAGVHFSQTLMRQSWDALTFIVQDPDGNLVLFAGPTDSGTQAT